MSCTILSVSIDTISSEEIYQRIESFIHSTKTHHIITANSIMIKQACGNNDLSNVFRRADLVVADSVGVIWAAKILKEPIPRLFPGIDLMDLCFTYAAQRGLPVYLLGGKQDVITMAVHAVQKKYISLRIAGFRNGYFSKEEENSVFEDIQRAHPAFVFVGIGSPRQEMWISKNLHRFRSPFVMGIGGSFDVIAGTLIRAPLCIRMAGCEWIFRTVQQPWRIWRIRQLPLFAFLVFLQKLKLLSKKTN